MRTCVGFAWVDGYEELDPTEPEMNDLIRH